MQKVKAGGKFITSGTSEVFQPKSMSIREHPFKWDSQGCQESGINCLSRCNLELLLTSQPPRVGNGGVRLVFTHTRHWAQWALVFGWEQLHLHPATSVHQSRWIKEDLVRAVRVDGQRKDSPCPRIAFLKDCECELLVKRRKGGFETGWVMERSILWSALLTSVNVFQSWQVKLKVTHSTTPGVPYLILSLWLFSFLHISLFKNVLWDEEGRKCGREMTHSCQG